MDPLSFLYIALGVGFLVLVIFICVTLLYVIPMLRDIGLITKSAKNVVERVNDFVVQPAQMVSHVIENIKPIVDSLRHHREQGTKRHSKE